MHSMQTCRWGPAVRSPKACDHQAMPVFMQPRTTPQVNPERQLDTRSSLRDMVSQGRECQEFLA